MNYFTDITGYRAAGEGVDLLVHLPQDIRYLIKRQNIRHAEVILDDGRHISIDQRKKIYATLRDISEYIGDPPEATKEWMKYGYIERTGSDYFSLSNCSMTTAREFINFLMDVCLQSGIILAESGLKRTDDINAYLIQCIRHKQCCICGRPSDIHHVDAIGMGNDRRNFDDSENDIIALCREHHTQAHSLGNVRFMERYKVYGIKKYQTVDAEDFGHFENITKM